MDLQFEQFEYNVDGSWSPSKKDALQYLNSAAQGGNASDVFKEVKDDDDSANNPENLTKVPNFTFIGDQSKKLNLNNKE